jgi:hypothetical protein
MEADDPVAIVIAALNSFEPARDDTDNLYRSTSSSRVSAAYLIGIARRPRCLAYWSGFPMLSLAHPDRWFRS